MIKLGHMLKYQGTNSIYYVYSKDGDYFTIGSVTNNGRKGFELTIRIIANVDPDVWVTVSTILEEE